MRKNPANSQNYNPVIKYNHNRGVSLIEILVVMAIVTMLMGITMPALRRVRRNALTMRCMNYQRQIVVGVTCFASDHHGEYPESVATTGKSKQHWAWQEPTMLTSYRKRDPKLYRSISAYLRSYIKDASIMFCPNAPTKYKYLQEMWNAGDNWDNPQTPPSQDPVMGTYCFYWNYVGFIKEGELFTGPRNLSSETKQSKLLISDYFGYGHWRNSYVYGDCEAYGSSERFRKVRVTPGTQVSSDFWSRRSGGNIDLDNLNIKLQAGYTDGHVERYSASEVVPMKVSKSSDGSVPYPGRLGPGIFYLPKGALH